MVSIYINTKSFTEMAIKNILHLVSSTEIKSGQCKKNHMILHALKEILHLNKKYLSDVKLPRIKYPILNISYTNGVLVCKACIFI